MDRYYRRARKLKAWANQHGSSSCWEEALMVSFLPLPPEWEWCP